MAVAAALGLAGGLSACSGTGITPSPLQTSVASTFAHLYLYQQVEQGNPEPPLASLRATASCQKGLPSTVQEGSGSDWLCSIVYLVAGPATPVTARYTVNVQTDGCYAADGDGPLSVNGSPTISGSGNTQIVNPLWAFDGCFDVT